MFLGNEKECVFSLLPGEQRVAELTIHHQHFFVVKAGVTRAILTTQRLLYTKTCVFSPVYWLLLVLFPPLIFYYVARLPRNRNVALPLGSIDSVEKRYCPNWLLFVLAILLGYLIALLCSAAFGTVFQRPHQHGLPGESSAMEFMVNGLVLGLVAPLVLIMMLATRMVRFVVRSRGGVDVPIWFSAGDSGVSEETFDAFFQKVHVEMENARTLQTQRNGPAT
jgi:hypothetical protein